jgi:hypothetical protein
VGCVAEQGGYIVLRGLLSAAEIDEMNAAVDQQIANFVSANNREPSAEEHAAIKAQTLATVRGTVQADILKEDQGQNTCIFSTEFSLKVMGDIQEYFTQHQVRNFYSVSISGYHIAEAGANPISQLAFTLSNGFTFVEAYLARGMAVDDFAHNLSFFLHLELYHLISYSNQPANDRLMAHHSHLSVICQLSQCTKSNQFACWICCPVFHQLTQTKDELIPHRRASIGSLARPLAGDYPILSCYSSSNIGTLPLVREGSSGSTSTSSSG